MPTNALAADPYTSWGTAGTNLIAVVNAAQTNTGTKVVWVTNGTYYLTNEVIVTSALTLQSVNGRDVTIVNGSNYPGKPVTNRCFKLNAAGVVLDGFTITNGYCISTNDWTDGGGGVYGASGSTVQNCRVTGCIASNRSSGGGIRSYGVITNCEIIGNTAYGPAPCFGGGIWTRNSTIVNCTIANNTILGSGESCGAGIYSYAAAPFISNCKIYGNTCNASSYGGGVCLSDPRGIGTIRNSLIYGNSAGNGGGISLYDTAALIQNCTVVSNIASGSGGGIQGFITANLTNRIEDTVCYFNTCASGSNIFNWVHTTYTGSWQIVNSCFAPSNAVNTTGIQGYYYANNTQADPLFAGKDAGNWRLTRDSLGVNTGTNQAWMDGAFDLDGRPRRDRFSRIVDMGCYEYLPQGAIFSGR